MLSFTIGKASISIMIDGDFNTVDKSAHNYEALKAELQKPEAERDVATIKSLISTKKMIEAFSYGKVKITEDEEVYYDGAAITNYLAERMLQILGEGYDVTPFAIFMDRVHANPAAYAKDELYEWLEAADLPIMADGRFVAFKKVKKDYKDCHSGMFDNSVGQTLVMERSSCDPNRSNECSTGFHFCSAGYLSNFNGERVMVLAVDPADVTAIPKDYNRTKGRTCRYEVIGELDSQSEAYKAAWKRGVVEFDNDQELPDVKFERRPNAVKLKPMQLPNARDKATFTIGAPKQGKDATKVVATKPVASKSAKVTSVTTSKPVVGTELVFQTKSGVKVTETQLRSTLARNSGGLRPSARDLNVQDSSLRSWIKKLEEKDAASPPAPTPVVKTAGPKSPLAATPTPTGLIFKTTDGREIAESDVRAAVQSEGSTRGAARKLNVGESTVRGWRSKAGF